MEKNRFVKTKYINIGICTARVIWFYYKAETKRKRETVGKQLVTFRTVHVDDWF